MEERTGVVSVVKGPQVDLRMDLWTLKEGEGRANGADSVDIYALPRVKWTASGKLLYSTGRSGLFSVMT